VDLVDLHTFAPSRWAHCCADYTNV